jgi:hypothetical protein
MWISRSPNGPSAKCHVQNIHTMDELKMTGNCLRGSRGIVVFDGAWDQGEKEGEGAEEWKGLMKEMLTHVSAHEFWICNRSVCCVGLGLEAGVATPRLSWKHRTMGVPHICPTLVFKHRARRQIPLFSLGGGALWLWTRRL